MDKTIIYLIFLVLIASVSAEMCPNSATGYYTNCTLAISPLSCTNYNYTIYNITGSIIQSGNLTSAGTLYTLYVNVTQDYIVVLCDGTYLSSTLRIPATTIINETNIPIVSAGTGFIDCGINKTWDGNGCIPIKINQTINETVEIPQAEEQKFVNEIEQQQNDQLQKYLFIGLGILLLIIIIIYAVSKSSKNKPKNSESFKY